MRVVVQPVLRAMELRNVVYIRETGTLAYALTMMIERREKKVDYDDCGSGMVACMA